MSAEVLREIRLYGHLGREFGRVHRLAVQNAAEAVRALCALFPRFEAAVVGHDRYHVITGDEYRDEHDLAGPVGRSEVIKIVPAVAGAKSNFIGGLIKFVAGAVLVFAGFVTGQAWLVRIGLALALGGVAQMLTPTPKKSADPSKEDTQSYVFSGPANVSTQGAPIPIGYGRMIVGSVVVSAGITAENYVATTDVVDTTPPATFGPYPSNPGYTYPTTPADRTVSTGPVYRGSSSL